MGKSNRSRRQATLDVTDLVAQPKRWIGFVILGFLIRWRAELVTAAVVLTVYVYIDGFNYQWLTGLVMLGIPALLLSVRRTRRFVVSRVWCVTDRHRLRACLKRAKVRTFNRDGTYPYMVWARPTAVGERIWLWLPAGMAGSDIEHCLEYLAPACFARSARLHTPKKLTTFVAVDVIRRDPLDSPKPVFSPLSVFGKKSATASEQVTPIKAAPSVREHTTTDSQSTSSKTTASSGNGKSAASKPASSGPTVVVSGEDLSDYVD